MSIWRRLWTTYSAARLLQRYGRTHDLADLERAIGAAQQAVAQSPPRSSSLTPALNTLSIALSQRYGRTHDPADLERAIGSGRAGSRAISTRRSLSANLSESPR
jgi:hypothetical protein